MPVQTPAEILRCEMAEVYMQLKATQIPTTHRPQSVGFG